MEQACIPILIRMVFKTGNSVVRMGPSLSEIEYQRDRDKSAAGAQGFAQRTRTAASQSSLR